MFEAFWTEQVIEDLAFVCLDFTPTCSSWDDSSLSGYDFELEHFSFCSNKPDWLDSRMISALSFLLPSSSELTLADVSVSDFDSVFSFDLTTGLKNELINPHFFIPFGLLLVASGCERKQIIHVVVQFYSWFTFFVLFWGMVILWHWDWDKGKESTQM